MTQYPGLTQREAQKNRLEYGDNLLQESSRKNPLRIFLAQFQDLMTLILLASTAISLAMGERVEALTIVAIVVLNALLGFFQEWRTERSLEKLNELAAPTATVIRDGHNQVIPAREVTIGDLVLLKAGDRVPADCRILENQALLFDESLLTGESVPVEKIATPTTAPTICPTRSAPSWGPSSPGGTAKRWSTPSGRTPAWDRSR